MLGPNGAGKTTSVGMMLGLVAPDEGAVTVLGHNPCSKGREVRQMCGALLESDGLYERMSAYHNLDYYGRIYGLPPCERRVRIRAVLEPEGLWERRGELVMRWSRGMRRRLAVARAMLHRPRVLLLDEPFAGLDPSAAIALGKRLAEVASNEGTTVVIASHDLVHVEKIARRVGVFVGGAVVAEGPTDSVAATSGAPLMELARIMREGVDLGETQGPPCGTNVVYTNV